MDSLEREQKLVIIKSKIKKTQSKKTAKLSDHVKIVTT